MSPHPTATTAVFGWGAPLMIEQFPALTKQQAKKFDDLNRSIIMCHLHGLIPDSVRDSAIKKCTRQIEAVLTTARSALSHATAQSGDGQEVE